MTKVTNRFPTAKDEDEFIEDNGDWRIANTDRNGLSYYADRRLAEIRYTSALVSDERKQAATVARESITDFGYQPIKTGTPKQKAWAEQIRKDAVDRLSDETKSGLIFETSSKFFIDNRDNFAKIKFVAETNAVRATETLDALEAQKAAKKAAASEKKVATASAKSAETVFKATTTYKRMSALLSVETIAALVARSTSEDFFAKMMTLNDTDFVDFADLSVTHRTMNTNDPRWHAMKAEIIGRFGFRL